MDLKRLQKKKHLYQKGKGKSFRKTFYHNLENGDNDNIFERSDSEFESDVWECKHWYGCKYTDWFE